MLYTVLFFPKNDIYEVRCGRVSERLSLSETIVAFGVCACKHSGRQSKIKKSFFMINNFRFQLAKLGKKGIEIMLCEKNYSAFTNFNICTPFLER